MFKNEYQGGPFVEIFSSQGKDPVAKWKLCGSPAVQKVFDKEVKSYVYILEGSSQRNKMQLPKDSKQSLGLIQRFLVLQLCVPVGQDFSTELLITDLGNIKRRLYLSTIHKELSATPLHAKIPLGIIKRKIWSNVCIDMVSFANAAFKGAGFQSLDRIVVSANCKLRKIFTMKLQPLDTTFKNDVYSLQCLTDGPTDVIPKCCQLGIDVDQVTQLLNVVKLKQGELRLGSQPSTSTDLDQQTNGATASVRSVRSQDVSHIAFGSKVLGPPPTSGRKAGTTGSKDLSVLMDNKTARSSYQPHYNKDAISERLTGRSERRTSTRPEPANHINEENICFTKQTSEAVSLAKPKDEIEVLSEDDQIEQPRRPQEPSSDRRNRRKLHLRLSDMAKNGPIDDQWHFPDHSESSLQFISSQQSISYPECSRNTSHLQINENKKENESRSASLSEDDEKDDELKLKDIFTFSSQPRSAPRGKMQTASSECFTWTVDMKDDGEPENPAKRGAHLEDDFHQNYDSEEDDMLNHITKRPVDTRTSSISSEASFIYHTSHSSMSVASERTIRTASGEQTLEETPFLTLTKMDKEKIHINISPVLSRSPTRVDAPDSTPSIIKVKDGQANPSRASMVKKSLKEIPKKDPRLTTETCPVNQGHHYQNEMLLTLSQKKMNPLLLSNPRDWGNIYSPPIILPSEQLKDLKTALSPRQPAVRQDIGNHTANNAEDQDEVLDLLYDPCLNCYFDPKTGKYYELA
ncbi:protein CFAP20DC isoform X2 [Chiloscyllium punctatum]|uniref:protein CFAP20DC isoform X2 n=1 Tax=Chiloscyllium punctatum TaxID=137246 RepID=UPI003B640911